MLAIHEACEGLVKAMANGQLAGQSAEHIRAGYRKQIVGSHLIFFTCKLMRAVDVVRILNQRMAVAAHFWACMPACFCAAAIGYYFRGAMLRPNPANGDKRCSVM